MSTAPRKAEPSEKALLRLEQSTSPDDHTPGNQQTLMRNILEQSIASDWENGRLEWRLESIDFAGDEEACHCLCGHSPIKELCFLENWRNKSHALVGNCCVMRFFPEFDSRLIFAALKRIRKDIDRALNPATIAWIRKRGWIDDWQRDFYLDTWRKRQLTLRQLEQRVKINKTVLGQMRSRRRR